MKSRTLTCITAVTLFVAMGVLESMRPSRFLPEELTCDARASAACRSPRRCGRNQGG